MKYICTLTDAGNANMYSIGSIFSNISKGPQYLAANFGQLPNLIKILFGFTFKNTFSPTLKYLKTMFLYAQLFFLSWATFKFCFIFSIYSSIYFNNYVLTTALFAGLSQLIGVLYFLPYNALNRLIFNEN
jgi:hypothetical protein